MARKIVHYLLTYTCTDIVLYSVMNEINVLNKGIFLLKRVANYITKMFEQKSNERLHATNISSFFFYIIQNVISSAKNNHGIICY